MIQTTIIIKATSAEVWEALTLKDKMKEWYFDIPDFELRKGAVFNFFEPGGSNKFHHRCTIKEIIPEKKFSHTWTYPSHSNGESVVTWLLNEKNGATEVILQHNGIENFTDAGPEFAAENFQMGWEGFMAILKNYIYGLRKHTYQVEIKASPEKIWNVMWNDSSYRKWTSVFSEGSYFKGELKQGGRVHFLTPEGSGVYAVIVLFSPYSNILFKHIGEVVNFAEHPVDDATEKWTGAFENYIIKDMGNTTILVAEIDLSPDYIAFFNEAFPKGLEKIKELAEF